MYPINAWIFFSPVGLSAPVASMMVPSIPNANSGGDKTAIKSKQWKEYPHLSQISGGEASSCPSDHDDCVTTFSARNRTINLLAHMRLAETQVIISPQQITL